MASLAALSSWLAHKAPQEEQAEGVSKVTARILFVDDDTAILEELEPAFLAEGYLLCHVLPGLDAIRKMLIDQPDLVILGINSQEKDWQFCQRLLTFLDRPLLLLLSTVNKLDRVTKLPIFVHRVDTEDD